MAMTDEAVTPAGIPRTDLVGSVEDAAVLRREVSRLAALDKVKSDYLDLVSHELRGPLGVARGYVSMIADGSLGDVDQRTAMVLPVVLGKLDEMGRLVDQLLLTARLEDSRLHLDRCPQDVRGLLRAAVEAVQPRAAAAGRTVVMEEDEGELICAVDAPRILTALGNLLDNAVKYSPAGSQVRCSADLRGGCAELSVADDGDGIPPDEMPRLFTRFGRTESAANRGIPGTGLGLYISRELARRHGGDIAVSSRPGAGATFTMSLPLA